MPKGILNTYLGDYQVPTYKLGIEDALYLYLGDELIWTGGPEWEWADWQMPADVNRHFNREDPDQYGLPKNSGWNRNIVSDNDVIFSSTIWPQGNNLEYAIYSPVIKRTGGFTISFDYINSSTSREDYLTATLSVLGSNTENGNFITVPDTKISGAIQRPGSGHCVFTVPKVNDNQFYKISLRFYAWNNSDNHLGVSCRISNLIISRN